MKNIEKYNKYYGQQKYEIRKIIYFAIFLILIITFFFGPFGGTDPYLNESISNNQANTLDNIAPIVEPEDKTKNDGQKNETPKVNENSEEKEKSENNNDNKPLINEDKESNNKINDENNKEEKEKENNKKNNNENVKEKENKSNDEQNKNEKEKEEKINTNEGQNQQTNENNIINDNENFGKNCFSWGVF